MFNKIADMLKPYYDIREDFAPLGRIYNRMKTDSEFNAYIVMLSIIFGIVFLTLVVKS